MEKQYELTDETIKIDGKAFYRICALRNFGNVKKDDLSGLIKKERNLSHEGECWFYNNAKVLEDAVIFHNVKIFDDACIGENASVYSDAEVYSDAHIYGRTEVFENARIRNSAQIYDNACVSGGTIICGPALIYNNAKVYDDVIISCSNFYEGDIHYGNVEIFRNAEVCGLVNIRGNTRILQDIKI